VAHHCDGVKEDLALTKALHCQLVRAQSVKVLLGSETLANDVVAGQLALLSAPGIVLSNGEFGCRLKDHAKRIGPVSDALELEWGAVFEREQVRRMLERRRDARWLWACACETSTGVLNELEMLKELCAVRGVKIC